MSFPLPRMDQAYTSIVLEPGIGRYARSRRYHEIIPLRRRRCLYELCSQEIWVLAICPEKILNDTL